MQDDRIENATKSQQYKKDKKEKKEKNVRSVCVRTHTQQQFLQFCQAARCALLQKTAPGRSRTLCNYSTISAWRVTWQPTLTETGRPAIWVGPSSIFTHSAVTVPPKPCGPMPSLLIESSISCSSFA